MENSRLTITNQNPAHKIQECENERARALAHAAKVTRKRRHVQPHQEISSINNQNDLKTHSIGPTDGSYRQTRKSYIYSTPGGGNSDPFDAMPVRVTSANSLFPTLWQAHLASNRTMYTMKISPAVYLEHLYVEDSLHLQCLFYVGSALLSSIHWHHQGLQLETLKHRVGCYKSLGQEISSMVHPGDWNVLLKRLSLILIATLLTNERSEAKIHARRLYDEITACSAASWLSNHERDLILCLVHYYDNVCAMVYLDYPVLDIQKLQQLWYASDAVQSRSTEEVASMEWWRYANTAPCSVVKAPIFSKHLEHHFNMVQGFIDLQAEPMSRLFKKWAVEMPLKNPMGHTSITSSLLAYLRHARAQYPIQSRVENQLELSKIHAELILISALLASFACRLTGPVIFPLSKAGSLAMKAMRGSLEQNSVPMSYCFDPLLFRHIQLWALYIGATWEWDSGVYRSGKAWFAPRLQVIAQKLGLTCWEELIAICDGFLYIRASQVQTSVWFLGMDWPEHLSWVGAGRLQESSARFLSGLLFTHEDGNP